MKLEWKKDCRENKVETIEEMPSFTFIEKWASRVAHINGERNNHDCFSVSKAPTLPANIVALTSGTGSPECGAIGPERLSQTAYDAGRQRRPTARPEVFFARQILWG
jgi:hypothetical protein